jgi:tetratricopeptide (TPR) repeat protein
MALGWLARGRLDQCRGQALAAEGHLRRALELFVSAGDRRGEAHLLSNLGVVNQELGLHARSERMHRSAMNLLQESGDEADLWRARVNFGALLAARGDATAARRQLEECLEFGSTRGYPDVAGANLALLRDQAGDWATALTLARRALHPLQEAGLEALAGQVQAWLDEWAPSASSGGATQGMEGLPPL